MTPSDKKPSFLDETQREGRASGKVEMKDLDTAIANVHVILDPKVLKIFQETPEENFAAAKMAVFCQDCGQIVPAGVGKTLRGKARTICGTCKSKKIAMGTEEALSRFYHLDKKVA